MLISGYTLGSDCKGNYKDKYTFAEILEVTFHWNEHKVIYWLYNKITKSWIIISFKEFGGYDA